jgi:hypothetical protein
MQLERRFDWKNTELVYRKLDEQKDFETAKGGMVFFTATAIEGKTFRGKCYPSTGAAMVDAPSGFWKLELPKGAKYSIVIPCSEKGTLYKEGAFKKG